MEFDVAEGEGDVANTGSVLDSTDCVDVVFPFVDVVSITSIDSVDVVFPIAEVVSITSLVVDSVDSYLVTVIQS